MRPLLLALLCLVLALLGACGPCPPSEDGGRVPASPEAPPACAECRASECGPSLDACLPDLPCAGLVACEDSCGPDRSCGASCASAFPSYRLGQPLRQCVHDACAEICPGWA